MPRAAKHICRKEEKKYNRNQAVHRKERRIQPGQISRRYQRVLINEQQTDNRDAGDGNRPQTEQRNQRAEQN